MALAHVLTVQVVKVINNYHLSRKSIQNESVIHYELLILYTAVA